MKILAFSDYRVQDIDLLTDFIKKMDEKPDLILYGGDDLERFVERKLVQDPKPFKILRRGIPHFIHLLRPGKVIRNRFEEIASLSKLGLCAVIGNDDHPRVRKYIRGKKVHSVQEKPLVFGNYVVIGIEGAIDDPKDKSLGIGFTLYNESSLKKRLEETNKKFKGKKIIILSHSPPRNALDLAYRFGIRNIGSESLRDFVEKNHMNIPLVVCGHVHLQGGKNTTIGKTTVVNAASHDAKGEPGKVAIIDDSNDNIKISWHEMYGIDGIFQIGPVRYQKFKDAGIMTVDELFTLKTEDLCNVLNCGPNYASKILIRAKAVFEKRIIPLEKMLSIEENAAFLDIETDLRQELVWLIGIYFKKSDKLIQLVAHKPSQEKSILNEFLKNIKGFRGKIYTFSGTKFDERVLKNRLKHYKMKYSNFPEFIDLATYIQRCYALPLKSYSLKSIASHFAYNYKHPDLSGMTVALEYLSNYQNTQDKNLMKKLLEYNEDDIRSLPWMMERLTSISQEIQIEQSAIVRNPTKLKNRSHFKETPSLSKLLKSMMIDP